MIRKTLLWIGVFASAAMACSQPTNDAVKDSLAKDLTKYSGVTVQVDDCIATLSGSVDRLQDKLAATRKAKSYGALVNVVNKIGVNGPVVADADLAKKIAKELAYDRVSQGNVFDWFTVASDNGAITVTGFAHNPMAHVSAIALIENTKGVKDIVDKVEVLPVSIFDDQIRVAAARQIYGGSSFIGSSDPAHPIRIIVENGHVILEGVVNSSLDSTVANMKANGLFGVFSVENRLVVKKG